MIRHLLLLIAVSLALPAAAAPAEDLQTVRREIDATRQRLNEQQTQQRNLQNDIRRTRSELEAVRRELAAIADRRENIHKQLTLLQNRLESLQTQIRGTQTQVARLIENRYRNRQNNSITLFLQNADPQEKARHLAYMRYLNQGNEQALRQLQENQNEARIQETAVNAQLQELDKLKRRQEAAVSRLNRRQQEQIRQSENLNTEIRRDNSRLERLRQNEQRLNRITGNITRQSARRQRNQTRNRPAASRPAPQQLPPPNTIVQTPAATPPATGNLTAEDLALSATVTPATATATQPSENIRFARLQGNLPRPSAGRISGRFGRNRPEGGTWKGLFFETPPSAVHSVAAGQIAYAAPLQGYGNTVIIDHGDNYLTIYGGLSDIRVGKGSRVGSGTAIGTSGTLPEGGNGVYFEIRYNNRVMNPAAWLR